MLLVLLGVSMHDFQFFNKPKIDQLLRKEYEQGLQRKAIQNTLKELRQQESREKKRKKEGEEDGEESMISQEAERLEKELEQLQLTPAEVIQS